jgi:hypothetical protein
MADWKVPGAALAVVQDGKVALVKLSGDGKTAIVGGWVDRFVDTNSAGAAWVYTRTGDVWSQQGAKLVGEGAVGGAEQGVSVALSGDGKTAIGFAVGALAVRVPWFPREISCST